LRSTFSDYQVIESDSSPAFIIMFALKWKINLDAQHQLINFQVMRLLAITGSKVPN